jgi:hypothetical protein
MTRCWMADIAYRLNMDNVWVAMLALTRRMGRRDLLHKKQEVDG